MQMLLDIIAYSVLGIVLLLFNLPTLLAILSNSTLRVRYAVLSALLFPCCLSGVQCIGQALIRITVLIDYVPMVAVPQTALLCLIRPTIFFDQFTYTAVPVMLMINSIDRLIAVVYPILYFLHTVKCILIEIAIAYMIIFSTLVITFIWAIIEDSEMGTVLCLKSDYLPYGLYTFLAMIRVGAAIGSIIVMGIVLFKLKDYSIRVAEVRNDAQMLIFIKRQKCYTKAMLISCGFTFVFFVVPSCVALHARLTMVSSVDEVTMYARFITFINSLNMVVIVVTRQDDIKYELLKWISCCLPFSQSNHLAVIPTSQRPSPLRTVN